MADRHKHWFGLVKKSILVGTDNVPTTKSHTLISSSSADFEIRATTSTDDVW